jgi:hypothetical protein
MKQNVTPWGEVGYLTFKRTYARRLDETNVNSATEEFTDTIKRVVEASNSQLGCNFTPKEQEELTSIL